MPTKSVILEILSYITKVPLSDIQWLMIPDITRPKVQPLPVQTAMYTPSYMAESVSCETS